MASGRSVTITITGPSSCKRATFAAYKGSKYPTTIFRFVSRFRIDSIETIFSRVSKSLFQQVGRNLCHSLRGDSGHAPMINRTFAQQARTARKAGKEFWVTELQAEPWTDHDSRLITPDSPSANLSPQKLRQNVIYARKSGAERIYLWGSEWWLYQSERFGDDGWLESARESIADAR